MTQEFYPPKLVGRPYVAPDALSHEQRRAALSDELRTRFNLQHDAERERFDRAMLAQLLEGFNERASDDSPLNAAEKLARLSVEQAKTHKYIRRMRKIAFIIDATDSRKKQWEMFLDTLELGAAQMDNILRKRIEISLLYFKGNCVELGGVFKSFKAMAEVARGVTTEGGGSRYAESIALLRRINDIALTMQHAKQIEIPKDYGDYFDAIILSGDRIDGTDIMRGGENVSPVQKEVEQWKNSIGEQTPVFWFQDIPVSTRVPNQSARAYMESVCDATRGMHIPTSERGFDYAAWMMATCCIIADPLLAYGLLGKPLEKAEQIVKHLEKVNSPAMPRIIRKGVEDIIQEQLEKLGIIHRKRAREIEYKK